MSFVRLKQIGRTLPALAATAFASGSVAINNKPAAAEARKEEPEHGPKLVFLGSGSSTGCPKPLCTLLTKHGLPDHDASVYEVQESMYRQCRVSRLATEGDPKENKNYRNNPSLLISHLDQGGVRRNIIIDVGKTFRETSIRWLPDHGIQSIDAVILTHHHMDAVAGLDDLRGFQQVRRPKGAERASAGALKEEPPTRVPISLYVSRECLDHVSSQFPWLFPAAQPSVETEVKRDVAALDVHVLENFQTVDIKGLKVTPLPVWHGDDLVCLGFAFSLKGRNGPCNVLYLSDISRMIPETLEFIQEQLPQPDVFVVDALIPEGIHPVHFSLEQAVALARQVKAKQTYLLGMDCDRFLAHDEMNSKLAADNQDMHIRFAYDGQAIKP